jgi:hypothetical protein
MNSAILVELELLGRRVTNALRASVAGTVCEIKYPMRKLGLQILIASLGNWYNVTLLGPHEIL